ncbi:minor capsid protein [Stackebrandtia soli]|uniref:minor capsid protein n=1 Tax=Stackebrandtia soli TaxID=1892856 RepID=UPI0039EC91DB
MAVRMEWNGKQVSAIIEEATADGLRLAAEHLLGASRRLVPLEEGTLERSGRVSVDEGALQAAVSYDTVYAVRQHEELTYQHDAGRSAKYLERPMNSEGPTMAALIAAAVRKTTAT